ncbi:MAG: hypothetical protein A2086_17260 [Spirochaetes bacterium GWD1_27_9]|nr:MAG: hypothetical protein A2Z98_12425 [Spirochaetes bacterium GWB1_27_13]OHD42470.1 MAG: hypothetical protein A2086_17260 [Spirochaetes bacterium GWD1_27_9]
MTIEIITTNEIKIKEILEKEGLTVNNVQKSKVGTDIYHIAMPIKTVERKAIIALTRNNLIIYYFYEIPQYETSIYVVKGDVA